MFQVSWSSSITRSKNLRSFMKMTYQGLPISGALGKTPLEGRESHSCWDWYLDTVILEIPWRFSVSVFYFIINSWKNPMKSFWWTREMPYLQILSYQSWPVYFPAGFVLYFHIWLIYHLLVWDLTFC